MKCVYLIDDHCLVRVGLERTFAASPLLKVVGGANSVETALPELAESKPDLVTLDLQLPGLVGVAAVKAIRGVTPTSSILIISSRVDSEEVRELVAAGVRGYLTKEARVEEMMRAAEAILGGQQYFSSSAASALANGVRGSRRPEKGSSLSPRLVEILRLIEKGKKTNEIAEILMLSPKTIEKYRGEILRSLDCRNQIEALEKARALKIL